MEFVLVTGANGFIGRHTCRHLVDSGFRVRGSVRQAAALPDQQIPSVDYGISGPIDGGTDWRGLLAGIDVLVHCAARVHVRRETAPDPLAAFRRVNVAGTERLARQATGAGVRRFILISSIGAAVAADAGTGTAPPTPYQLSKLEGEAALVRVAEETGLEAVILRPPMIYGAGGPGHFDLLLKAVKARVPLPFASIRNRRSLLYVGNLVDAVRVCIAHPAAAGRILPLSDGPPVSTPELVRALAAAAHRRPMLLPFPPGLLRLAGRLLGRTAAVTSLTGDHVLDDREIRARLGWQPCYSMATGLAEALADQSKS